MNGSDDDGNDDEGSLAIFRQCFYNKKHHAYTFHPSVCILYFSGRCCSPCVINKYTQAQ